MYNNNELAAKTEMLEKELQFLRKIVRYSNDRKLFVLPNMHIEYLALTGEPIAGYPEKTLIENKIFFTDLIIPEDRKKVEELIRNPDKKVKNCCLEIRIKTKTGEIKWAELLCNNDFDKNNNYTGCFITLRDITSTKNNKFKTESLHLMLNEERELFSMGNVVIFKTLNKEKWPVHFISGNAKYLFGYTKKEIESKPLCFADFVHPDDLISIKKRSKLLEGNTSKLISKGSYRIITKSGKTKWVKNYVKPKRDPDGTILYYTGYLIDISDEMEQLDLLNLSEKKFEKTFSTCPNLHAIIDLQNRKIEEVNNAFLKKMGYYKEEILGKTASEVLKMPEKTKNEIEKGFIEKGAVRNKITSLFDKNNNELKVELTAAVIEHNSEKKIFASAKDITELFRKENLLKMLSVFAEYSKNSALITDNQGIIQWVNPGFIRNKGYTFNEVRNKFYGCLFNNTAISGQLSQVFSKKRNFSTEWVTYTKSGSPYWVNVEFICNSQIQKLVNGFVIIEMDINAIKIAEEKVEKANEYLSTIIDNAPVFITSFNDKLKCTLWNKYAENIFGYTLDELNKQENIIHLFFPDRDMINHFNQTMEDSPSKFLRVHPVTKWGKQLEVMQSQFVLPDKSVIYIGYDITEMADYEQRIIESEKRFREFIETTKHIHLRQDFESCEMEYISPSVKDILGYDPEEILKIDFEWGKLNKLFDEKHEMAIKNLKEKLLALKTESDCYEIEFEMNHKNGSKKWIKASYYLSKGSDSRKKTIIGVLEDIDKEKQAELNLRKSEESFRGLVERLDEAIFRMKIPDGEYEYFSRSAFKVFGYPESTFLGTPFFIEEIIHPDDMAYLSERLTEILDGIVKSTFEYRIIDSEGNIRWIKQSNKGIYNHKGKLSAIEGLCRNITREKDAEQKLIQKIIEIESYQKQLKLLNTKLARTEENERKSIASYLHDGIGQILAIANIKLTSIYDNNLNAKDMAIIDDTSSLLKEAINQTRSLTYDLNPPMIYEYGLRESLKWRLEQINQEYNTITIFDAKVKQIYLHKNEEVVLYRVINELLNNCIKHSKATQITLRLFQKANAYQFIVEDNGVGFSYKSEIRNNINSGKYGLFNINERLDSINAVITFTSQKNKGTKAIISINIQND